MKKSVMLVIVLLSAALMLSGCFSVDSGSHDNTAEMKLNIYDDDAAIASNNDTYRGSSSSATVGEQSAMEYSDFDGSITRLQFIVTGEKGQVAIVYDSTVAKGRFKTVLVDEGGKVTTVFEGSGKGEKSFDLPTGTVRMVFVGDAATGRFQLTLKPADNVVVESLKVNTQPIRSK